MRIFSVRDAKAETYMTPFFLRNTAMAIRSFTDAVLDESTPIGKYPEDYALFEIGGFDEFTGEVEVQLPYCVCKAFDVIPLDHAGNVRVQELRDASAARGPREATKETA